MNEIREVHHYDDVNSSNNTALFGIFIVALVAILGIGLAMWQPWAASPAPSTSETTIIERPSEPGNTTIVNPPDTTIINPPAEQPSKTEININEPPVGGTTGEGSGGAETGLTGS
jgi:hypothetical protein